MDKGARYYKCDFQVHTPRDINFSGQAYVDDNDRQTYSERFVAACRSKKLDAVAITDHHDLMFYQYIRDAALNEKDIAGNPIAENKRLIVFPGIELTLDVPCQSLLLFDASIDLTDELIIKIYTALKISGHTARAAEKTGHTARLPFKSNNDVFDALNEVPELRGKFIIFPNIKDGGGDTIFRENFYNEYANGQFVGGYLDRGLYESHKSKVGWNRIIDGKVSAYGDRVIGLFQTSDNRTDTFEHLGVSATWVKWSSPTAEGLRQACLAKKSRILQEEPKIPTTRVREIKLTGSAFLKELHVEFNPQFNVCIGGRGTGKSSLLQYLSWALGKDAGPDKRNELDAFVRNTLGTGSVEVSIIKTGIVHVIRRSLSTYEIKIGNDEWQPTNSSNVVSIIKSDSFSQKELSRHEKDKTEQLTKIIENAVSAEVESIKRQLTENGNRIREVSATYETFLSNLQLSRDLRTQIESLEEQINALNDQLQDVPAADQTTIRNNSLIENEKSLIKASETQISGIVSQIDNMLERGNFNHLSYDAAVYKNAEAIETIVKNHNQILDAIKAALQGSLLAGDQAVRGSLIQNMSELHSSHDTEYAEAKGRQTQFEQIIGELEDLRRQLEVLRNDQGRVLEALDAEKDSRKQLQKLFFQRGELNTKHYQIINGAVADIAGKSEGTLEIELTDLSNIDFICEKFGNKVTSSKGQPQRTRSFFDNLIKGDLTYKQVLKFWLSIYKAKIEDQKIENVLALYSLENNTLLETDFERISDSMNTATIIDLALDLPTYDLKLMYCKDTRNKIPFEDASYGQQAGSILTILLNQEFGPLIIDQPEDDLDNKVIHQITENIVSAKHKRQLIFSSHNANIAVNGDAELILSFDHNPDTSAGEIIASGSIDKDEIKLQVKDIMEGGVKAFDLRQRKYGF